VNAGALYDIANINPHSELDPPLYRNLCISLAHGALNLDGATQCVHGTDKQDEQAIPSCPYDATPVFFYLGLNELSVVSTQLSQGAFIVDAYQAAVASYIRHQDCHKSAFDLLTRHR